MKVCELIKLCYNTLIANPLFMFSKKVLVAIFALAVVSGGTLYYGSSPSLQGKFGGISSTKTIVNPSKTTSTPTVLLTVSNESGSADNSAISMDLLATDYFDYDPEDEFSTDPRDVTLATLQVTFAEGASSCGSWGYAIGNASTAPNWDREDVIDDTDDFFSSIVTDVRKSSDSSWSYDIDYGASSTPTKKYYDMNLTPALTGSDYYLYIIGHVQDALDTSYIGQSYTLQLREACVSKEGKEYKYADGDTYGQNAYFSILANNSLNIGSLTISQ